MQELKESSPTTGNNAQGQQQRQPPQRSPRVEGAISKSGSRLKSTLILQSPTAAGNQSEIGPGKKKNDSLVSSLLRAMPKAIPGAIPTGGDRVAKTYIVRNANDKVGKGFISAFPRVESDAPGKRSANDESKVRGGLRSSPLGLTGGRSRGSLLNAAASTGRSQEGTLKNIFPELDGGGDGVFGDIQKNVRGVFAITRGGLSLS